MLWDAVHIWGILLGVSHDFAPYLLTTLNCSQFPEYMYTFLLFISFRISYFFAQILNKCHLFSLALYFPPPKVNLMASSHV